MNMIERVARTIYLWDQDDIPEEWDMLPELVRQKAYQQARASIRAMREPSDAMASAGGRAVYHAKGYEPMDAAVSSFRAMIDAALEEYG